MDEMERNTRGLVSSPVVELTLSHGLMLKTMFRNFASKKHSRWSALKKIHVICFGARAEAYDHECKKLAVATKNVGAVFALHPDLQRHHHFNKP
ncbi:hypothetical protein O1611_g5241 [Lasiodiplodia mahajangana]|uniref:Uncharacterized protein n=1 Tax=Lasiodiplodia mahajangana TaxID=1108764 RepID=A0ACC2JLV3_9PEZI|nr:hypothetical protein O1611_g5241 [Lasiodiplodia mahajangana]